MNSPTKKMLIFMVTVLAIFTGSISSGKEVEPDLVGTWSGGAFLQAMQDGFSPAKDIIKINIYQQDDLKFKGTIERIWNGRTVLQDCQGYLDINKRNICLIDQKTNDVIIGYITKNGIMKLYSRVSSENNKIILYFLVRKEAVRN